MYFSDWTQPKQRAFITEAGACRYLTPPQPEDSFGTALAAAAKKVLSDTKRLSDTAVGRAILAEQGKVRQALFCCYFDEF